jgi:hypothetical protein
MALNVAILDTNALENKGSYGRLVGLLRVLDVSLPHHEVTVYHRYYDVTNKERIEDLKKYHPNVKITRHLWYNEKGSLIATTLAYTTSFSACVQNRLMVRSSRKQLCPVRMKSQLFSLHRTE